MKIIDCFMFFQELDLLEIRLNYLDPHVDIFVIVEACQTFTGKEKPFVFEENKNRYKKFLKKIIYFKITDFHQDYDSVISYLRKTNSATSEKVLTIMEEFNHFPKDKLHWVLDCYHRECIQFPLREIANDNDIVFLSDLDEIPSNKIFGPDIFVPIKEGPVVCSQKEYSYFLNFYRLDSRWLGSIYGYKQDILSGGMNGLRMDVRANQHIVKGVVEDGGYHFTSVGTFDDILKKIESWGHQEFNTPRVKRKLRGRILSGQDPFGRKTSIVFNRVDPDNSSFFDKQMNEIIIGYSHLIASKNIKFTRQGVLKNFLDRFINFFDKIIYKIK